MPFVGGAGIEFAGQARFHPRKYLAGVARTIADRGGLIFEHTSADEFCDSPRSVKANGHTISCEYVVIATHTPLVGHASLASATLLQTKLALYTTYVVGGAIEKGRIPDALFWDSADPYHYLRIEPQRDHDVVIFGGEDHKTGQTADTTACFERLERTLRSMVGDVEVTHRWSGQIIGTPDGLPFSRETAERQFDGTRFSGKGLSCDTLTEMMAADRILGRQKHGHKPFVDNDALVPGQTVGLDERAPAKQSQAKRFKVASPYRDVRHRRQRAAWNRRLSVDRELPGRSTGKRHDVGERGRRNAASRGELFLEALVERCPLLGRLIRLPGQSQRHGHGMCRVDDKIRAIDGKEAAHHQTGSGE